MKVYIHMKRNIPKFGDGFGIPQVVNIYYQRQDAYEAVYEKRKKSQKYEHYVLTRAVK